MGEYFALLGYTLSRRDALDQHIAELALTAAYATAVATLQCVRGLQVHRAMVLATALVDWRRFDSPRKLMAYLGFVPREHSRGPRARRGSITKAGNTHGRHVLVQAWKAQQRWYAMYHRLSLRRGPQIAVVAVARGLVGYLWAVMRDLEVATAPLAAA